MFVCNDGRHAEMAYSLYLGKHPYFQTPNNKLTVNSYALLDCLMMSDTSPHLDVQKVH